MNSLKICAFLLTISFVSAFNLLRLRNDSLPKMEETAAGLYARIANGHEASRNQSKYQAGLLMEHSNTPHTFCGGSLISSEWVLTAAHCIIDAQTIYVYLGSLLHLQSKTVYHVTRQEAIHNHNYKRKTYKHDIAVVKIPEVRFSDSIHPVRLPARAYNHPSYAGGTAIFSGWGHTSDSVHQNSPSLRYCELRIIANDDCEGYYTGDSIYRGKMCTSSANGTSACRGDSGGPLVFERSNIQVGIASFGNKEGCEFGYPYAFTRVDAYLAWINQNTGVRI